MSSANLALRVARLALVRVSRVSKSVVSWRAVRAEALLKAGDSLTDAAEEEEQPCGCLKNSNSVQFGPFLAY